MDTRFWTVLTGIALAAALATACGEDEERPPADPDSCFRCPIAAPDAGVDGAAEPGCGRCERPAPYLAFERVPLPDAPRQATTFEFAPDTSELLVARKSGVISRYVLNGDDYEQVGEFEIEEVWSENDCGLLALAFDPEFADNRFVYAAGCIGQTANRIWRLTLDRDDDAATAASAVEILTVEEPDARRPFHNAGSLNFDADGHLLALFGDKVQGHNGQELDDNLGALLRIDPSRDPESGGYTPAPGNPFEFREDASPDVYAYGLRAPWRGSIDRHGRLWIADPGRDDVEEIDVVTEPGMNFGWDEAEGPCGPECGFSDPIVSWPRDPEHRYILDDPDAIATESRASWIGVMYEDRGNDRYEGLMTDRILFGDFCPGWIRVLEVDPALDVLLDEFAGHLETVVQWRQGPDGYLYALTFGSCGSVVDEPKESKLYRAMLE